MQSFKKAVLKLMPFLLLIVFTVIVFSYSLPLRRQWFGKLVQGDHHFLTGSTIKFTKNWINEKPWNLFFGMLENPKSVEFDNLTQRLPYVSYPPGTIVPIYLISVLTHEPPSASIVMNYNLANHFLISLILGFITYLIFRKYKFNYLISFLFSLIPISMEIFLPGPFYFLQNIYFSDQAVILPYVLTILLEKIYDMVHENKHNGIKILQSFVILYGASIDWFFYFLIAAIFLKRMFMDKNPKKLMDKFVNNVYILVLGLMPILFLAWQIVKLNAFNVLLERFLTRTGISFSEDSMKNFWSTFWWSHFRTNFGETGVFLYWTCLILITSSTLLLSKIIKTYAKINQYLLYYCALFLFLPLIQVYVFRNHSLVHDFSTLKFSLTLSIIPFALFPLLIMNLKNLIKDDRLLKKSLWLILILATILIAIEWLLLYKYFSKQDFSFFQQSFFYSLAAINPSILLLIYRKKWSNYLVFLVSILLAVAYLYSSFPLISKHFKRQDILIEKIGNSIANCTNYHDIVFSFELEVPDRPTVLISQSMKRVYIISFLKDIYSKIEAVKKPFQIKLFYYNIPTAKTYKFINSLGTYNCLGYYYSSFSKKQLNDYLLKYGSN